MKMPKARRSGHVTTDRRGGGERRSAIPPAGASNEAGGAILTCPDTRIVLYRASVTEPRGREQHNRTTPGGGVSSGSMW